MEDPLTHKRVPTINRTQYTSIYMDEDYKSAIKHADTYQKSIYEEEAKIIDDIQKGILSISQREEPFDVFICYKETDYGKQTYDSKVGMKLYDQLSAMGYKVFFSRVTLNEKLGIEFEPYIFAALKSSIVMVVIGTKPEYFEATWVKNEWSRFLRLKEKDPVKQIFFACDDIGDLPKAFARKQAQILEDDSSITNLADNIHNYLKLLGKVSGGTTRLVRTQGGKNKVKCPYCGKMQERNRYGCIYCHRTF